MSAPDQPASPQTPHATESPTAAVAAPQEVEHSSDNHPHWTAEHEIALFDALTKFRPVGVHKHFRMLSVQRHIHHATGTTFTVAQLWSHLSTFYELEALDAMADETDDDISFDARRKRSGYPFKVVAEFQLPPEDFDNLIVETRKAVSPGRESTPEVDDDGAGSGAATAPPKRGVGRPRKGGVKKDASEPPMRRTRAASGSAGVLSTPTPAAKRPRRNA
ncbi:chromatin modification-related protein EAF7-domain-containing protein [Geranomyces variabilis]|nr:chromatin modification-related protein EAF7-domain-containing protein [Geranomyces variabilis]KAJ3138848.1 hypothetical protein HDU90_000753 [Geranomyces variabilis]